MRGGSEKRRGERGQALILGALALVVLFGFTALSVDVGFFLRHRAVVQQAVDAAALAGAQALPDDKNLAEQLARDFAAKNGVDPASVQVSFRCTSNFQLACDASAGKWDTIQVTGEMDVPFFFAPVLQLTGATTNCWLGACPVINSAAGCRGLCGSSPFTAVDVVTTIDHTASMSATDLQNVKDGTMALYEYFDADIQRVGLAVTPPVDPTNYCDSINLWTDPQVWVPVPLTFDYQTSPHVLDSSSPLVSTTQCLDRPSSGELPGVHTKLGDPIRDAIDELQANGRPDVKWGIILETDGAANIYTPPVIAGNTARLSPSAQAAVTSSAGDNNGFESSPTNAYADGGGNATDANTGTGTSTSCTNSGKDRHRYYNYGVSVPAGATVTGIESRLDAWVDSTAASTRLMCVDLSWDGGSTWTSAKSTPNLSTSEASYYLGGSADTWGRSWSASDLSNANFRVRVTDVSNTGPSTTGTLLPTGNGTYTAWTNDVLAVDDVVGSESCSDYVQTGTTNARESFTINLSSIPDGATITSVDITPWDRGATSTGGTYQTSARLNGTDTNSGTNIATTSTSGCTQRSAQNINVADTVKSGSTTLQIGVLKTSNNTNAVRVGVLRAVVNYQLDETFHLDWVPVQVYYTTPDPSAAKGPCDYAAQQADAAKALDIEVFTLGFGVNENCTHELAGSPWTNVPAVDLLRYMATDSLHFFNEPRSADLAPIFQVIGAQLSTGSRLVPYVP